MFSQVQDHVIAAANAHVERLVLEAFVDKVRALPEDDSKVALRLLCDLFALSTIEADRAWFMEHGRLYRGRARRRSAARSAACAARSGRSPWTWSTRGPCRPRCSGHRDLLG